MSSFMLGHIMLVYSVYNVVYVVYAVMYDLYIEQQQICE